MERDRSIHASLLCPEGTSQTKAIESVWYKFIYKPTNSRLWATLEWLSGNVLFISSSVESKWRISY